MRADIEQLKAAVNTFQTATVREIVDVPNEENIIARCALLERLRQVMFDIEAHQYGIEFERDIRLATNLAITNGTPGERK